MKSQQTKILILGGGFAGVMAALRLAGKTRKEQVEITLVSAQAQLIERTRMHQFVVGQKLKTYALPHLLRHSGVQFVQGTVTHLHPVHKQVVVENEAATQTLAYDKLVYALGSFVDLAKIPGAQENAFTMDWDSAQRVRMLLPEIAQRNERVAVIGAGLTGLELATELAECLPNLQVSLLCAGDLGADLSAKAENYVRSVVQKLSISLYEQCKVSRIEPTAIHCADGQSIQSDLCLVCTGFAVSPLAKQSGITVNALGQILLDEQLRSISHPDIYGAGDAATLAADGMNLRMACATAMPMAAYVADSISTASKGKPVQPFGFGFVIRCISLGRKAAVVQFVEPNDQPKSSVLTGQTAVWAKEAILQFVIRSMQLTRIFASAYQWPQSISAQVADKRSDWQLAANR